MYLPFYLIGMYGKPQINKIIAQLGGRGGQSVV